MVWYGMVWYGMVWYGMVWYGMVWYGMVWYGIVWYGMVWYSMVWYGMVCYAAAPPRVPQPLESVEPADHLPRDACMVGRSDVAPRWDMPRCAARSPWQSTRPPPSPSPASPWHSIAKCAATGLTRGMLCYPVLAMPCHAMPASPARGWPRCRRPRCRRRGRPAWDHQPLRARHAPQVRRCESAGDLYVMYRPAKPSEPLTCGNRGEYL
jgi:hypothetical protein